MHLAVASVLAAGLLLGCTFDLAEVEARNGEGSDAGTLPDGDVPDSAAGGSGGATADSGAGTGGSSGSAGGTSCFAGTKSCDGQCVQNDDPLYGCASTGCAPCPGANATFVCSAGACVLEHCSAGYGDCDNDPTNGCETNTLTDTGNCGGCGQTCSDNHVSNASCADGVCHLVCAAQYDNCNGDLADGCETSLSTASHCGSCGNACESLPHAYANCSGTTCSYQCEGQSTMDRYENCNGDWSDGCEVYITGNPDHCGTCYNVCEDPGLPNVHRTCDPVIPTCTGTCNAGYYNCNGTWSDGCESTSSCQ